MRFAFALLLVACAASPPRGPYFGDEQLLVVGVVPDREADALVAQMERHGRPLLLRVSGVHFTALGFGDASGAPSAVRVVTTHGIALALDAEEGHALSPGRAWRLLSSPLPAGDQPAASSDEFVFAEERGEGREPCVRVYRVRPSGEVAPETRLADPAGRTACAAEGVDGAGATEAAPTPAPADATSPPAR